MNNDPIIEKFKEQITVYQAQIDELMQTEFTGCSNDDVTLNQIGFYVECIKSTLESMAIYQDTVYGL